MQQQEKETKKQADERRRKEAERLARDPLQLNYIKASPEDIFKDPNVAKKALSQKPQANISAAPKKKVDNTPSIYANLEDIMKSQGKK